MFWLKSQHLQATYKHCVIPETHERYSLWDRMLSHHYYRLHEMRSASWLHTHHPLRTKPKQWWTIRIDLFRTSSRMSAKTTRFRLSLCTAFFCSTFYGSSDELHPANKLTAFQDFSSLCLKESTTYLPFPHFAHHWHSCVCSSLIQLSEGALRCQSKSFTFLPGVGLTHLAIKAVRGHLVTHAQCWVELFELTKREVRNR